CERSGILLASTGSARGRLQHRTFRKRRSVPSPPGTCTLPDVLFRGCDVWVQPGFCFGDGVLAGEAPISNRPDRVVSYFASPVCDSSIAGLSAGARLNTACVNKRNAPTTRQVSATLNTGQSKSR